MTENVEFNQIPVSCGLDVHKKTITACIIAANKDGKVEKFHRTFSTMTHDLEKLRDWIIYYGCLRVAMESTGPYWKPVYNILEEENIEVLLANARHVKNLPGRKTDMSDAEWLANLNRNGLIRGSFIPPRVIRELRDLCRLRNKTVEDRTRIKNRISQQLEDANIKIGSVASDLFGVSGKEMLKRIASGSYEPEEVAKLARRRLKNKHKELCQAAYGRVLNHHRTIISHLLKQLSSLDELIKELETIIDKKARPYKKQIELLDTIPGVDFNAAVAILAEVGADMSVFPTHKHISSWAGVCPGNNESAGKNYSGRVTKGNLNLKRVLCQSAWAASQTKNTYLARKYWSLKSKRGAKKAITAIAHKILIAVFHILKKMEPYRELSSEYLDKIKGERTVSIMAQRLKILGYEVVPINSEPAACSLDSP